MTKTPRFDPKLSPTCLRLLALYRMPPCLVSRYRCSANSCATGSRMEVLLED